MVSKRCPICGATLPFKSDVCPYCSASLDGKDRPTVQTDQKTTVKNRAFILLMALILTIIMMLLWLNSLDGDQTATGNALYRQSPYEMVEDSVGAGLGHGSRDVVFFS